MTGRKAKKYSSFRDLFERQKADIIQQCDLCGECLEKCPVYPLASFSDKSPADVQRKLLDALEGKPSEVARDMAYSCAYCATCMKSCHLGLNPYHLQEILKAELVGVGCELPLPKPQIGNKVYDLPDMVCHLQIKPSQRRWITEVPARPEHKDVVLFLGCSIRAMPEKSLALLDLLEMMGIDFVALGGGSLCCGGRYLRKGDINGASKAATNFITALEAFHPQKVAFTCGTCVYEVGKVFPAFTDVSFQSMHVSKLLADNVHRLKFTKPVAARVVVHDPCNMSRKSDDIESARKLIGAIPGVTLVEMAHNRLNSLCCGASVQDSYPKLAGELRRRALDEARETGAQIMASVCTGCHRSFCLSQKDYPFEIKNYINLVAEAAGLTYEDKLKKYLQMGTADEIVADAREFIEASPYTVEEFKKLLPFYFAQLRP